MVFWFRTSTNVNFTDEARHDAELTQLTYIKYDKKYTLTSPRCLVKDIKKPATAGDWRIAKMDGAGPGSYESPQAFDKTQKPKEYLVSKQTSNRNVFTDRFAKLYANNPGVGMYKECDRGFKVINKPTFE